MTGIFNFRSPQEQASPAKRPIPLCYNCGLSRTIYGISMRNVTINTRWTMLCLLILSAGLYIGTAAKPALDDEDVDAAHAMVSQEMLQRHDFVVPVHGRPALPDSPPDAFLAGGRQLRIAGRD